MSKKHRNVLRMVACLKFPVMLLAACGLLARYSYASVPAMDITGTLRGVQGLLMQIGPMLSAVLFILGGVFYAVGQLFPSYKRASLHTMAIDIIVGAIVVAVLSVASTNLAIAATHLLSNASANAL